MTGLCSVSWRNRARSGIASGEFKPGTYLPSEIRLSQEYGIGREAIRRAMALLRREGLVTTTQGEGTSVRPRKDKAVVLLARGERASARMPSATECRQLGIEEGVPVFVVYRADGQQEIHPGDRTKIMVA